MISKSAKIGTASLEKRSSYVKCALVCISAFYHYRVSTIQINVVGPALSWKETKYCHYGQDVVVIAIRHYDHAIVTARKCAWFVAPTPNSKMARDSKMCSRDREVLKSLLFLIIWIWWKLRGFQHLRWQEGVGYVAPTPNSNMARDSNMCSREALIIGKS